MTKDRNLIFLSGVDTSDNLKALKYIKTTYPKFKNALYIPAGLDGAKEEFKQFKKDFKAIGVKKTNFLALENETPSRAKEKISQAEIVFLGGGNTFYFYSQITKNKLKTAFINHVKKGRLLIGLSAGGIIMTPTLMMACYPDIDADELSGEVDHFKSLGFTKFEICPHYRNAKKMNLNLMTYTALYPYPVYGLRDGSFYSHRSTRLGDWWTFAPFL